MKKRIILTLLILMAWTLSVYAAVQLTFTIPTSAVQPVLDAFSQLAGAHMTLEARSHALKPEDKFYGRWDFRIAPKDPNETNKQFGERFTKELIRASVRLVKSAEENQRYRDEINEVSPPKVNVPDEIVQ